MILRTQTSVSPVCPDDLADLDRDLDYLRCRQCGRAFPTVSGILELLPRESGEKSAPERTQLDSYQAAFSARSERAWYQPFRFAVNVLGNGFLYAWAARTVEQILETRPSLVLDAACGDGILRRFLSKGHVHAGIDFSQRLLGRARRYHPSTYYRADLAHLPFLDATFDAVISIQTLQYLQRPEIALAEIARTLKPHGKALITVPNYQCAKYRLQGLHQLHLQLFDRERITALLSKHFDILRLETQGLWIPIPKFSVHLPGVRSLDRGLAWTVVASVKKRAIPLSHPVDAR